MTMTSRREYAHAAAPADVDGDEDGRVQHGREGCQPSGQFGLLAAEVAQQPLCQGEAIEAVDLPRRVE